MWNMTRGFLPKNDPIKLYPPKLGWRKAGTLEDLAGKLPLFLDSRKFRHESIYYLRGIPNIRAYQNLSHFIDYLSEEETERCMMLFSYFASAFVYAPYEIPATTIPKEIAVPLVYLADKVKRKPILSYANYCLTNWQKIDQNKPIELGNIKLLQHFSMVEDEDWFILVHVAIENAASELLKTFDVPFVRFSGNYTIVGETLLSGLKAINSILHRMPEKCNEDVYFQKVRPYIFGFKDVIYEGCFDNKPQTFRGETGAQSSIIPAILPFLGITHTDSLLTQHLNTMREYMPLQHREFIVSMETTYNEDNFRTFVIRNPEFKQLYKSLFSGQDTSNMQ